MFIKTSKKYVSYQDLLDIPVHLLYIYKTILRKGADIPMMMIYVSVVSAVPFGTDERGVSASVL